MGYQVDNAVIMAAGLSSRFAPISYEKPKALIQVKGEVLIERQIRQLLEKGISNIILVTGYKQEQFYYLQDKFNLNIIENKDFNVRNNNSSIYAAKRYLRNTYICSADNYFLINPFEPEVDESYYAAVFAPGRTDEWCLQTDEHDYITGIQIGGNHQWYMLGHVFWSEDFSSKFVQILEQIYEKEETKGKLWEDIYRENLSKLKMKIRRYGQNQLYEFDSLDELRLFDERYKTSSGSRIMSHLAKVLDCSEESITNLRPIKDQENNVVGVMFSHDSIQYQFFYGNGKLISIQGEEKNER